MRLRLTDEHIWRCIMPRLAYTCRKLSLRPYPITAPPRNTSSTQRIILLSWLPLDIRPFLRIYLSHPSRFMMCPTFIFFKFGVQFYERLLSHKNTLLVGLIIFYIVQCIMFFIF